MVLVLAGRVDKKSVTSLYVLYQKWSLNVFVNFCWQFIQLIKWNFIHENSYALYPTGYDVQMAFFDSVVAPQSSCGCYINFSPCHMYSLHMFFMRVQAIATIKPAQCKYSLQIICDDSDKVTCVSCSVHISSIINVNVNVVDNPQSSILSSLHPARVSNKARKIKVRYELTINPYH